LRATFSQADGGVASHVFVLRAESGNPRFCTVWIATSLDCGHPPLVMTKTTVFASRHEARLLAC